MKKLLAVLLLLFSAQVFAEPAVRDVTLSWAKPVPMFTDGSTGSPSMQIDSYTFEYTASDGAMNSIVVQGYDTETIILTDVPAGEFSVRGKSWCSGCNLFSAWGATFTTTITIQLTPGAPQIIDIVIVPEQTAGRRAKFTTTMSNNDYKGRCSTWRHGRWITCTGRKQN